MDKELATHAAGVLRAVAHPIRLRVIELLEAGELCVGAISAALDEKQAITSQQLTIMKDRGILTSRPGRSWSHTRHTRSISLAERERIAGGAAVRPSPTFVPGPAIARATTEATK